jgi:hypothetical protein
MPGRDQPTRNAGEKPNHDVKAISKLETDQEEDVQEHTRVPATDAQKREDLERETERLKRERERLERERERRESRERERELQELEKAERAYFKALKLEAEQKIQRRKYFVRSIVVPWLITLGLASLAWYMVHY